MGRMITNTFRKNEIALGQFGKYNLKGYSIT